MKFSIPALLSLSLLTGSVLGAPTEDNPVEQLKGVMLESNKLLLDIYKNVDENFKFSEKQRKEKIRPYVEPATDRIAAAVQVLQDTASAPLTNDGCEGFYLFINVHENLLVTVARRFIVNRKAAETIRSIAEQFNTFESLVVPYYSEHYSKEQCQTDLWAAAIDRVLGIIQDHAKFLGEQFPPEAE